MATGTGENLAFASDQAEQAANAFIDWAKDHTNEVLEVRPYDPEKNPDQRMDVVTLEPSPDLDVARRWGRTGMGAKNYDQLVKDLRSVGATSLVKANLLKDRSTLFGTAHLRDTFDTALTHNVLLGAMDNEGFADQNVVIANTMMKFLNIGGVAVPEVLTLSGRVIFGVPVSGGRANGVPTEVTSAINRLASPKIKEALADGVALHRAMTGTRAKDIILPNGQLAKMIPLVPAEAIKSVVKRMPDAVGIAMDTGEFGNAKAFAMEPQVITAKEQVHEFMEDIAYHNSQLANELVFYGLPEGAQILER